MNIAVDWNVKLQTEHFSCLVGLVLNFAPSFHQGSYRLEKYLNIDGFSEN